MKKANKGVTEKRRKNTQKARRRRRQKKTNLYAQPARKAGMKVLSGEKREAMRSTSPACHIKGVRASFSQRLMLFTLPTSSSSAMFSRLTELTFNKGQQGVLPSGSLLHGINSSYSREAPLVHCQYIDLSRALSYNKNTENCHWNSISSDLFFILVPKGQKGQ